MFFTITFTLIPTVVFYLIFSKLSFLKSGFLRIAMSWFAGQYIFTWIAFILALLLRNFTTGILFKASIISLFCFTTCLLWYAFFQRKTLFYKKPKKIFNKKILPRTHIKELVVLVVCFLFAYFFFINQLQQRGNTIYTSPAYWDFQWHMPLIQNFSLGDNFPPENESFGGFPATYHFFWGVVTAIYASAGLGLVGAINFVSIVSLFMLLLTIVGFAEDVFGSISPGVIAVLLTITTSSFHIVSYIISSPDKNIFHILYALLTSTAHPYFNSFIDYSLQTQSFAYDGPMFNMFYFLAERQIIFGMIYLLICIWIVYKRHLLSKKLLLLLGCLMGFYFLWHLYITIMIAPLLLCTLIFAKDKKQTLCLLIGFGTIFSLHYTYFKLLEHSQWFLPGVTHYPKVNFGFSTWQEKYPFSLSGAIIYYAYAYGFKLIALCFGLFLLWKNDRKIFTIFLTVIIPTFILVNTVQLSPLSIYDNHKWLRPLNLVIDLVSSYAIYILLSKKVFWASLLGITFLILVTASGLVELPPFLNAQPNVAFGEYPSPLTTKIMANTPPRSIFIGDDGKEIQFAGRKLFLGNYSGQDLQLNSGKRQTIINAVYAATTATSLCAITSSYPIDYVEFVDTIPQYITGEVPFVHFEGIDEQGHLVVFVNVSKSCQKIFHNNLSTSNMK